MKLRDLLEDDQDEGFVLQQVYDGTDVNVAPGHVWIEWDQQAKDELHIPVDSAT